MAKKKKTNKKTKKKAKRKAAKKKSNQAKKQNVLVHQKSDSEKVESLRERVIKIEPEYKEKIKSDRWKIPEFTKTDSPLYDSITKIMSIFSSLKLWPPNRDVLRWCAHKPTFLSELLEPIKEDLELLTSRLEEKFPHCSKKISDLLDELKLAFREHNIHLLQGPRLLYLLPPEQWNDFCGYEEFLRWRDQEIMWALAEAPNIDSYEEAEEIIKGLTCTYPAEIIKICAEIYKELENPYKILLEQRKPEGKEELPELTDTESNILEALNCDTLTGPKLLKKAGYDNSSHYRSILSNLVKRKILGRNSKGYYALKPYSSQ